MATKRLHLEKNTCYVNFIYSSFFPFMHLAQINPQHVEIVRDQFGVPHIFGKTDQYINADVAYGPAWAHAEDDF